MGCEDTCRALEWRGEAARAFYISKTFVARRELAKVDNVLSRGAVCGPAAPMVNKPRSAYFTRAAVLP